MNAVDKENLPLAANAANIPLQRLACSNENGSKISISTSKQSISAILCDNSVPNTLERSNNRAQSDHAQSDPALLMQTQPDETSRKLQLSSVLNDVSEEDFDFEKVSFQYSMTYSESATPTAQSPWISTPSATRTLTDIIGGQSCAKEGTEENGATALGTGSCAATKRQKEFFAALDTHHQTMRSHIHYLSALIRIIGKKKSQTSKCAPHENCVKKIPEQQQSFFRDFSPLSPVTKLASAGDVNAVDTSELEVFYTPGKFPMKLEWKSPVTPPMRGDKQRAREKNPSETLEFHNNSTIEPITEVDPDQVDCADEETQKIIGELATENEKLKTKLVGKDQETHQLQQVISLLEQENATLKKKITYDLHSSGALDFSDSGPLRTTNDSFNPSSSLLSSPSAKVIDLNMCSKELLKKNRYLSKELDMAREENERLRDENCSLRQEIKETKEENIQLAGHKNSHQRIRYVESLKMDNKQLMEKIKRLEREIQRIALKHGSPPRPRYLRHLDKSHEEVQIWDSAADVQRNKLFRKVWDENKRLKEECARRMSTEDCAHYMTIHASGSPAEGGRKSSLKGRAPHQRHQKRQHQRQQQPWNPYTNR